jgi:transposase-like protein
VKRQIVEMTLKGSGVRDTARVLQIDPNTVLKELNKGVRSLAGEQKRRQGEFALEGEALADLREELEVSHA